MNRYTLGFSALLIAYLLCVGAFLILREQNNKSDFDTISSAPQLPANTTFTPYSPAPNNTIPPNFQTTTAIIWGASATIYAQQQNPQILSPTQSLQIQSPEPNDQIHPNFRTATAVIWRATQTAYALPELTTYTPSEKQQRIAEILEMLETTLGFSHPILEERAAQIVEDEVKQNRLFSPERNLKQDEVEWNGSRYIAVYIANLFTDPYLPYLDFFQLTGDSVEYLDYRELLSSPYEVDFMPYQVDAWGFDDRNQNGQPDFPLFGGTGGSGCHSRFDTLLEIDETGQFRNLVPQDIDVTMNDFIDMNGDGLLEWRGSTYTYIDGVNIKNCPVLTRFYGWNGQEYVEVSDEYEAFYLEPIESYISSFNPNCKPISDSYGIFQMLLYALPIGRVGEYWEITQEIMWGNCTKTELAEIAPVREAIETWIAENVTEE